MRKKTQVFWWSLLLFVCTSLSLSAESNDTIQAVVLNNFIEQGKAYPQEKIHLHIDRPAYLSGERVWFKAHLVSSILHEPFAASRYVYVELVNSDRQVVSRVKVRQLEGYAGYLDLPEDLPEGSYSIRAYTYYMNNFHDEYDAYVPITVSDPMAAKMNIQSTLNYEDEGKVRVTLFVTDRTTGEVIEPTSFKVIHGAEEIYHRKNKDGSLSFTIKMKRLVGAESVIIECDKYLKSLPIPLPVFDYDVTFHPEGGNLIEDAVNQIAFKAIDSNGRSINLQGEIVDEEGAKVTDFSTTHEGMGTFVLQAGVSKAYYAQVNYEGINRRFRLPPAIPAIGLTANISKGKLNVLLVNSPTIEREAPLYLVVHSRGYVQFVEKWEKKTGKMTFEVKNLPSGILHLLLINEQRETLSERLIFCEGNDLAGVTSIGLNKSFGKRDFIPVELNLSDADKQPLQSGSLSLAVVDNQDVDPRINPTILASLLLTSDLKGYIAHPNYYFNEENKDRQQALDLLMLTHGWRRYDVPGLIRGEFTYPEEPIEIGQVISGQVKSLIRNRPMTNSKVSILTKKNYLDKTQTDSEGFFLFEGFELSDSTNYLLRAVSEKGSENVSLEVDADIFPAVARSPIVESLFAGTGRGTRSFTDYINKAEMRYTLENGIRRIHLPTIEITGSKKEQNLSIYSLNADRVVTSDYVNSGNYNSLSELLQTLPGVIIDDTDVYFTRNQNRPAAIYIDGVVVDRIGDDEFGSTLHPRYLDYATEFARSSLDDILPFDVIESVEIYRTAGSTVIFGGRGSSGVVMINTKRGSRFSDGREQYNMKNITPLGYQKPVAFYSPKYETIQEKRSDNPDLRTTIYWNPNLQSDETGKVLFNFYSADSSGTYTMIVEGVGEGGEIIYYTKEITIK